MSRMTKAPSTSRTAAKPVKTASAVVMVVMVLVALVTPVIGAGPFDAAVLDILDTPAHGIIIAKAADSSNNCPANYYSCASQGSQFDSICCPYDQVCALAGDNRPACCPAGDVCTGSAPTTYVTATQAASYVPNSFYSFPYLLPAGVTATTALADVNACDAVVQQCSATFSSCTSFLQNSGSGSGSDNVGAGGGSGAITVIISGSTTITKRSEPTDAAIERRAVIGNPTATLAQASAAGVCSSLSSQACGGLPSNNAACSSVFSGGAGQTGFSTGNDGTRQGIPSTGLLVAVMSIVGMAMEVL